MDECSAFAVRWLVSCCCILERFNDSLVSIQYAAYSRCVSSHSLSRAIVSNYQRQGGVELDRRGSLVVEGSDTGE